MGIILSMMRRKEDSLEETFYRDILIDYNKIRDDDERRDILDGYPPRKPFNKPKDECIWNKYQIR